MLTFLVFLLVLVVVFGVKPRQIRGLLSWLLVVVVVVLVVTFFAGVCAGFLEEF